MTFLGRFRSVRSRFLAVYVPLVVVAGAVVLAGYAYLAGRAAEKALDAKLDRVLTAQAKVANQPLWELDVERLELIAKAIAVDRDIAGVAFADEAGGQVVAVGTVGKAAQGLRTERRRMMRRRPNGDEEPIGSFGITVTDKQLRAEAGERLTWRIGFAVALLAAAVLAAVLSLRWTVGVPLARLADAVDEDALGGTPAPVDFEGDDEIGRVVRAFNRTRAGGDNDGGS